MNRLICTFVLLFFQFCFSQNEINLLINDSLCNNANAIVDQEVSIFIESDAKYSIKTTRKVVVLNQLGLNHLRTIAYYGKNEIVKSINATLFASTGKELKKFKRSDFKDVSVSENEGAIITDNRLLYLDFTPANYPFILQFDLDMAIYNTAFIPRWFAVEDYYCAYKKNELTIKWSPEVVLNYKIYENNHIINKNISNKNSINLSVENFKAIKKEDLLPSLTKITPNAIFSLSSFNLEGISGKVNNWEDYGKWIQDYLLNKSLELPIETQVKIKELIGNEKDKIKIAKKIYEYVQDKTRYVGIQLGIGGWKPMLAKEVDRLGYGDCKALTNYTRALLNVAGISSYYTLVYSGENKDINQDIVAMQGNHAILGVPIENEMIWLECTSQSYPFNFLGSSTQNRKVFAIGENNSFFTKTKHYDYKENVEFIFGNFVLDINGNLKGKFEINSRGIPYEDRVELKSLDSKKRNDAYRETFYQLNNLKINDVKIIDNKNEITFIEKLDIEVPNYLKFKGNQSLLALNFLNQYNFIPSKVKKRRFPFEIKNSYQSIDSLVITFDQGVLIDSLPDKAEVKSIFGNYELEVVKTGIDKITIYRKFTLFDGIHPPEKYEEYRKFREQIARLENSKINLITAQ